jgi:hypothetical protein
MGGIDKGAGWSGGGSYGWRGTGAGVDVAVLLRAEAGFSSLPDLPLLLEAFEVVLAFPGDVAGGVRSTRALISIDRSGRPETTVEVYTVNSMYYVIHSRDL